MTVAFTDKTILRLFLFFVSYPQQLHRDVPVHLIPLNITMTAPIIILLPWMYDIYSKHCFMLDNGNNSYADWTYKIGNDLSILW